MIQGEFSKGTKAPALVPGLVSIGIPTFERAGLLRRAIESALRQTYRSLEIIVSDNASTDQTRGVVDEYRSDPRLAYFLQPRNVGGFANVNFCLEKARGEFWLFLADDDWLEETAIERLLRGFHSPEVVMATGGTRIIGPGDALIREALPPVAGTIGGADFIRRRLKYEIGMYPSSELFRASVVLGAGGYKHFFHTDLILEIEAAIAGKIHVEPGVVCNYRLHGANAVTNRAVYQAWGYQSCVEIVRRVAEVSNDGALVRFARKRIATELLQACVTDSLVGHEEALPKARAALAEIGYRGWFWRALAGLAASRGGQFVYRFARGTRKRLRKHP